MIINYKEIKRKEVLFEIIDDVTNGMDIYNHNGSLWIINTKELKWVVEFTNDKTLWYNYNLFKNLFKAISLDISENQKYITEWFESKFLNMQKVKDSCEPFFDQDQYVEDTIQNGVKDTIGIEKKPFISVEDTIQNGVKDTKRTRLIKLAADQMVEDTIQNGVRHTQSVYSNGWCNVEDTIQNGVKQTELSKRDFFPKDIIQDGVKINGTYVGGKRQKENVEVVIDYGVKETYDDVYHHKGRIGGMIRNGKKLN